MPKIGFVGVAQERLQKFQNPNDIPAGSEMVFVTPGYTEDGLAAAVGDADCLVVDPVCPITAGMVARLPKLRLIHSEGVAFHNFDLDAAKKRGIFVCNNAGCNAAAVAEHTVMLMLCCLKDIVAADRSVREGRLAGAKRDYMARGLRQLSSLHVGLIGFGAIARETAARLRAFGSRVSYYDIVRRAAEEEKRLGVSFLELDDLFRECDIVSLHVPVTPDTVGLADARRLSLMKRTAFLINTSRGQTVDQRALAEAILEQRIAGAGLDVLDPEPPLPDNPLLNLPTPYNGRVIFTPHTAGNTREAFERVYRGAWENIRRVMNGERPNNIVNGL